MKSFIPSPADLRTGIAVVLVSYVMTKFVFPKLGL